MSRVAVRLLILLVLFSLMLLAGRAGTLEPFGARPATVLGFLLLAGVVAGQVAALCGLSRVTGYIGLGLLVGPGALGIVRAADVVSLGFLNDAAIALIALTAGGELNLRRLRGAGRYLVSISLVQMATVFLCVSGVVLLLAAWLPFTAGRDAALVTIIAVVLGAVAVSNSPAVAIAVITDTKSRGPLATAVLGVVVTLDVIVIVFFAGVLTAAHAALTPGRGLDPAFALTLVREIGGSVLVGVLLGSGVAAYLAWVRQHLVLFTVAVAWLAVELAGALHLEVLLLGLAAGFTLENLTPVRGDRFVRAVESASLPLYALFFALAGASVHIGALLPLWHWVLLLVGVRAVAIYAGTRGGARLGGAPEPVRRWAWLGSLSQAGVTLGMVTIVARSFPTWGAELKTFFVAMVTVHEIVGPIALNWALERAGEKGRAAEGPERRGAPGTTAPATG